MQLKRIEWGLKLQSSLSVQEMNVYAKTNDSLLAPDAPVELCHQSDLGVAEMEIVAQPNGPGEAIRTRSRQWLPIFERICTLLSSSPFQRKADAPHPDSWRGDACAGSHQWGKAVVL